MLLFICTTNILVQSRPFTKFNQHLLPARVVTLLDLEVYKRQRDFQSNSCNVRCLFSQCMVAVKDRVTAKSKRGIYKTPDCCTCVISVKYRKFHN